MSDKDDKSGYEKIIIFTYKWCLNGFLGMRRPGARDIRPA